jgi:hypothetical protein
MSIFSPKLLKAFRSIWSEGKIKQKALTAFIYSDYHNDKERLRRMFDMLVASYPHEPLYKEDVFRKALPTKSDYEDPLFRSHCFELNALFEYFLRVDALKKDVSTQAMLLAQAYQGKYEMLEKTTMNALKSEKINDYASSFLYQSLLFETQKTPEQESDAAQYLDKAVFYTEKTFIKQKLRLALTQLWRNTVYQENKPIAFLSAILTECEREESPHKIDTSIQLYIKAVRLYEANSIAHIQAARLFFEQHHKKDLTQKEQKQLFTHIQNAITREINRGNHAAFAESVAWYDLGLEKQFVFQEKNTGQLSETTFLNIANVKSICHQFDAYTQFVETYKTKLKSSTPSIILDLCHSNYLLNRYEKDKKKQDLDTALSLLRTIKPVTDFQKLTYHVCYIKLLYHQKRTTSLEALINRLTTFEAFLDRIKHISNYKRNQYLEFCKAVDRILDIENLNSKVAKKTAKAAFLNDLEQKEVLNKVWLMRQING